MMRAAVLFIKRERRTRLNGQLIDLGGAHTHVHARHTKPRDDAPLANTGDSTALCEMELFRMIDPVKEDRLCPEEVIRPRHYHVNRNFHGSV